MEAIEEMGERERERGTSNQSEIRVSTRGNRFGSGRGSVHYGLLLAQYPSINQPKAGKKTKKNKKT